MKWSPRQEFIQPVGSEGTEEMEFDL